MWVYSENRGCLGLVQSVKDSQLTYKAETGENPSALVLGRAEWQATPPDNCAAHLLGLLLAFPASSAASAHRAPRCPSAISPPSRLSQSVCVCLGNATGYGQRFAAKDERPFSCQKACLSGLPPNTNLGWLGTALGRF